MQIVRTYRGDDPGETRAKGGQFAKGGGRVPGQATAASGVVAPPARPEPPGSGGLIKGDRVVVTGTGGVVERGTLTNQPAHKVRPVVKFDDGTYSDVDPSFIKRDTSPPRPAGMDKEVAVSKEMLQLDKSAAGTHPEPVGGEGNVKAGMKASRDLQREHVEAQFDRDGQRKEEHKRTEADDRAEGAYNGGLVIRSVKTKNEADEKIAATADYQAKTRFPTVGGAGYLEGMQKVYSARWPES